MKPTSIIFLIVSVVLIAAGVITAGLAKDLAETEGVALSQKADEDMVFVYDYSKDGISTIKLDLKEAEVNIIGEAETSYIELINFPRGSYEFSSSRPSLNIINNWDGFSLSGVASFVSDINGLSGVIDYFNAVGSQKIVNIYLSPESEVDAVACNLAKGVVCMEKCNMSRDYIINIEDGEHYINGDLIGAKATD